MSWTRLGDADSRGPKTIPLAQLVEKFDQICRQNAGGLGRVQKEAFLALLQGLSAKLDSSPMGEVVEVSQAYYMFQNLSEMLQTGDWTMLLQPRGLKIEKPVDVEEFARSSEYLGQGSTVWPAIIEELWEIFHATENENVFEVILGGGIGTGKSFSSQIGIAYQVYLLSCYHCPQVEFGMAPGTPIDFVIQSLTKDKAKKVGFDSLAEWIRTSRYFRTQFPVEKDLSGAIKFPNHITVMPISSSDTAAMGMNVFGGLIDEINFMARVQNSTMSRFTGEEEYDQAVKMYTQIVRRMQSRYNQCGQVPGKLFLAASANYPGDFVDRKIKEAQDDRAKGRKKTMYVSVRREWEVKPKGRFSTETFLVEVGDEVRHSRILATRDDAVDPDAVVEVPVDFKDSFEKDLEGAIRDLIGVPVGGTNTFIKLREKLVSAVERHEEMFDGQQLFTVNACDLFRYETDLNELLNEDFIQQMAHTGAEFVAHVDLALTGDSCGISVSHVAGFQYVGRTVNWEQSEKKYLEAAPGEYPVFVVDGTLEVVPPSVGEIDFMLVGDLLTLIASRLNLIAVTADSFQSAGLLQRMRRTRNAFGKKIRATVVSVDADLTGYMQIKQSLRDDRLLLPNVPKMVDEFRNLQFDAKRSKIDHPPGFSKDLSDSAAGTIAVLSNLTRARTVIKADQVVVANPGTPVEQREIIRPPTRRSGGGSRRLM